MYTQILYSFVINKNMIYKTKSNNYLILFHANIYSKLSEVKKQSILGWFDVNLIGPYVNSALSQFLLFEFLFKSHSKYLVINQ